MLRIFFAILALVAVTACSRQPEQGPVVLAASSLQEAMNDTADAWAAKGHARPVLSFAGTSVLARQVESGAPADIFVSADEDWMDWLATAGKLRAGTRHDLLGNSLVLVGSPDHWRDAIWSPEISLSAMAGAARVAIADPQTVPAGRYARAALERLGEYDALEKRLVPAENVRAALALVERGQAELGIVYATDARASDRVVTLGSFPEGTVAPIRYPLAVLASSAHPDAVAFADFLRSPEAARIFAARGFEPLGQ